MKNYIYLIVICFTVLQSFYRLLYFEKDISEMKNTCCFLFQLFAAPYWAFRLQRSSSGEITTLFIVFNPLMLSDVLKADFMSNWTKSFLNWRIINAMPFSVCILYILLSTKFRYDRYLKKQMIIANPSLMTLRSPNSLVHSLSACHKYIILADVFHPIHNLQFSSFRQWQLSLL